MTNYYDIENADEIPVVLGTIIEENNYQKPKYSKFISKVLTLIFLQFFITFSICYSLYYYRNQIFDNYYIYNNLTFYSFILLIFAFFSLIFLACFKFKNICFSYFLYFLFTFSFSFFIGIYILPINYTTILLAITGTLISIIMSITYTFICNLYNYEFNVISSLICNLIFTVIPLSLLQIYYLPYFHGFELFLSFIFIIIFNLYLFYDLQVLYNHTEILIFKSPIYVANSLYFDIINIFLSFLQSTTFCNN